MIEVSHQVANAAGAVEDLEEGGLRVVKNVEFGSRNSTTTVLHGNNVASPCDRFKFENGGPVHEEEYGFSQEDADVSEEWDSLSKDDVEEGLEGRTGDATLVEDGRHGGLMVRPMVGFSA